MTRGHPQLPTTVTCATHHKKVSQSHWELSCIFALDLIGLAARTLSPASAAPAHHQREFLPTLPSTLRSLTTSRNTTSPLINPSSVSLCKRSLYETTHVPPHKHLHNNNPTLPTPNNKALDPTRQHRNHGRPTQHEQPQPAGVPACPQARSAERRLRPRSLCLHPSSHERRARRPCTWPACWI